MTSHDLSYLVRLEARHRASDLRGGLAARIADPLWMLGRQWAFGEWIGEDGGSPTAVDLAAEAAPLAWLHPASGAPQPYDPAREPLDLRLAEPPRPATAWTARQRIDVGRAWLRALRDAGLAAYLDGFRGAYALAGADAALRIADPSGARLIDVAAGRIPDGQALHAALLRPLRDGAALPAEPAIDAADEAALRAAGAAWLAFCDASRGGGDGSTWVPERLGHALAVGTTDADPELTAPAWRGGAPDWHAFDARAGGAAPTAFSALPSPSPLPAGIRFRGMPNARWWEFEDASIDPGAIDAGPSEVARLAFLEFALVYANDYFALPLRLPIGSLCRIHNLVVRDSFGVRQRIESAVRTGRPGAPRWAMFSFTQRGADGAAAGLSDLFLLPPLALQPITGRPLEDVLLVRDEMANLAWAIERRREGEDGRALEAAEVAVREAEPEPVAGQDAALRYRLGTTVPPHWFPLVPQRDASGLHLVLQAMADRVPPPAPRGRLLALGGPPIVDAEVPREGTRLQREPAMARWTDGSCHAWVQYVRRTGRGEGSSGLCFDEARGAALE